MTNLKMAELILEQLADKGVKTLCLCPGARNAAFVSLLSKSRGFEIICFHDERSAGFFALGRSRRDLRPAAVLTTSGTAVSELLSSVIEAYYSNTPLVVVSSDRPKRLRGTGAPQSIEQSEIFKNHVEKAWDLEACETFQLQASFTKPLHINICFEEPILDGKVFQKTFHPSDPVSEVLGPKAVSRKEDFRDSGHCVSKTSGRLDRSLVIVGGLRENQRPAVASSLGRLEVPLFLEALSGLRNHQELREKRLLGGERMVQQMLHSGEVQSVLRIGDVPLGRFWRDLDTMKIPILNISNKEFPGISGCQTQIHSLLTDPLSTDPPPWDWSHWKQKDRKIFDLIRNKAEAFPSSEVGLMHALTKQIPENHKIYIGNSLPIRIWDLMDPNHSMVFANRGANGIDGQLSTALGLHDFRQPLWVILGDLTTLYDFSGFWVSPYLRKQKAKVNLIVVNNHGGQIFSRIFEDPLFFYEHNLDFKNLARFWDWSYQKLGKSMDLSSKEPLNLYELCIDREENRGFWKEYDQLW